MKKIEESIKDYRRCCRYALEKRISYDQIDSVLDLFKKNKIKIRSASICNFENEGDGLSQRFSNYNAMRYFSPGDKYVSQARFQCKHKDYYFFLIIIDYDYQRISVFNNSKNEPVNLESFFLQIENLGVEKIKHWPIKFRD